MCNQTRGLIALCVSLDPTSARSTLRPQAIELYRKANRHTDAARLLSRLAKEAAAQVWNRLCDRHS
jgi:hypothetical protein